MRQKERWWQMRRIEQIEDIAIWSDEEMGEYYLVEEGCKCVRGREIVKTYTLVEARAVAWKIKNNELVIYKELRRTVPDAVEAAEAASSPSVQFSSGGNQVRTRTPADNT